jgi:hypothetical protein
MFRRKADVEKDAALEQALKPCFEWAAVDYTV